MLEGIAKILRARGIEATIEDGYFIRIPSGKVFPTSSYHSTWVILYIEGTDILVYESTLCRYLL